jgi:DNA polymerase-3 subunit beta
VKQLPGEIGFTLDGTTLTLKSGSRRFRLPVIPGDEMPRLPDADGATFLLNIPGDELADLISRVQFAISTDETRLHLNSMLLEHEGDKLTAVATDGHRLSVSVTTSGSVGAFKILIPLKGVLQLKRLCESGDVTLRQSGHVLFAEAGGFEWTCKLADAAFPPYQQVIPASSEATVSVDRLALMSAVKAVSVAANDRTGGVKFTFDAGKLRIESESPESGEGFDEIESDYQGDRRIVGFNARYVVEALGAMSGEAVKLGISGELDPMTIRQDGSEDVAVCMPLRVS